MRKVISFLVFILIMASCGNTVIKNQDFRVSLSDDNVIVERADGSQLLLKPQFTLIYSQTNPQKALRYGDHGIESKVKEGKGINYHIPTWGKAEKLNIDPNEHVLDGFNPEIDVKLGKGRTGNMFMVGDVKTLLATSATVNGNTIEWKISENEYVELTAKVTIEENDACPSITYNFIAKKEGYFSVGYTGAPEYDVAECEEIFQSDIWMEKRFPNAPYISESYRTKVPSTYLTKSNVTYGLVGAPEYIPFMPIPNTKNSQFGVMIRNAKGLAQSSIFAPVIGGVNSKMEKGDKHTFKAFTYVVLDNIDAAYEECGREMYKFSDVRRNATVTLNKTFENMIDYCMDTYSAFNDELRGCDYSSDVPGAVKNISGLHPLSIAVITDNEEIYKKRARPMIEYGLTRERFLFSTNPKITRDGTSSKLNGPGVPMSDLSTTYTYSGNRMTHFLDVAEGIYHDKINRSLNLSAILYGGRWQNALYLYRATCKQAYLDDAIRLADKYLEERVNTPQTDFFDKQSRGLFFWTSYTNQFMELYLMYRTTGEKRYLDAAHKGARMYTRLCFMSPLIPEGEVTVNKGGVVPRYRKAERWQSIEVPEETVEAWRLSEHGLTPESTPTCNGHRVIFMPHHAPFMMNIAAETGDKFLYDMARNAVIGRYENFPGYHMNAGRTTAFEKADFPLHSFEQLNAHTSMHFNHPWSHAAALMDYIIAEAYYASDRQIDMKPEYAEGYAYCRSLIYGANAGTFYGEENVMPYMPKQLLSTDNLQLNYMAARGNNKVYVAFTNQFTEDVKAMVTFDLAKAGLKAGKIYKCQVWKDNNVAEELTLKDGKVNITVSPKGITAIAIIGAQPLAPFQTAFTADMPVWGKDFSEVNFEDDQALIFNMGKGLLSAYFMTAANNDVFKKVTVKYSVNGGLWQSVSRTSYPYEFTVEIPDNAEKIEYYFEGLSVDGKVKKSKRGTLER